MCEQKRIQDIFCIIGEDIINMAENKMVDTSVNSANPSLMQGNGMDKETLKTKEIWVRSYRRFL